MNEPNSNTQTASDANLPPAAGQSPAELQAKIAELEKQSEGRLRDLQKERVARQEAEARLVSPAQAPSANAQPDVTQDDLGKLMKPYIEAHVQPLVQRVKVAEAIATETIRDKALNHLAAKTGKSKEAVVADTDLDSKLTNIVKRYALTGNVYDVTVRACEIMDLENIREQEIERKRVANAGGNNSLPGGTHIAPITGSKEYSEEDFNALPMHEYEKLSGSGSFKQNKDGKIVFTPTK